MTTFISSVLNRFKPQPKNIYQAIAAGKVTPDVVEGAKNAKKSAALYNAQGMMARGTEDQVKKAASNGKFKNIFASVKNSKVGQKTSSAFNYVKESKVSEKTSKAFNSIKSSTNKSYKYVADHTKSFVSKPAVKKGLKYGAIAALVLGALYLGKKAYDYYKDHKSAPAATGSVDVQKGDNVWNIAKKDLENKGGKVTNAEIAKRTEELMKLNDLKYANDKGLVIIKPGDKIKLEA